MLEPNEETESERGSEAAKDDSSIEDAASPDTDNGAALEESKTDTKPAGKPSSPVKEPSPGPEEEEQSINEEQDAKKNATKDEDGQQIGAKPESGMGAKDALEGDQGMSSELQQKMSQAAMSAAAFQSQKNTPMMNVQQALAGQANFSNQSLQLPLASQAMSKSFPQSVLAGKTPALGGLTGQNGDLFLQGLVANAAQGGGAIPNLNGMNASLSGMNPNLSGVTSNLSASSNVNRMNTNSMYGMPANPSDNNEDKQQKRLDTMESYRDFSRVPCSSKETDGVGASTTSSGKDPPFPVKLHRILSNPEYSDFISWLPHGRSWRVLKPKAFEEKIVPRYFRHTKYASFMRQVNGWGFKRMTQGPDHNSYYHELFLRGLPHLCLKMRRPARAKIGQNDGDTNPDFYRLSLVSPLPSGDNAANNAGLSGASNDMSYLSSLQANNANKQMAFGSISGNGSMDAGNGTLLPQHFQGVQLQNLGFGQLSGLNTPSISGINGGNTNMGGLSGGTNTEISQLDALRKRREELVRQLQGLKSQQPMQQHDAASMMNQMNSFGGFQGGVGVQPQMQLMPNTTSQLQQMMSMGADNSSNQMNGLLQIPGFSMGGGRQFNIGNLVGAGAAPAPLSGLNQQLLMQQSLNGANANGGLANMGMNNNLLSQQLNPLGLMMQNQMQRQMSPSQNAFNQQLQLQQQQQQHQNGQLGNIPQGPA